MPSNRDKKSEENFAAVEEWIKSHPGKWWRITDVERALHLSIPAITQILNRMRELKMVERNDPRKKHNGKKFPIYIFREYSVSTEGPAWFSPKPPVFASRQVLSIRFIEDGKNKHGQE